MEVQALLPRRPDDRGRADQKQGRPMGARHCQRPAESGYIHCDTSARLGWANISWNFIDPRTGFLHDPAG